MRDERARGKGGARSCDIYGREEKRKQKKKAKDGGTRMKMAARREQRRRLASYDHTQLVAVILCQSLIRCYSF